MGHFPRWTSLKAEYLPTCTSVSTSTAAFLSSKAPNPAKALKIQGKRQVHTHFPSLCQDNCQRPDLSWLTDCKGGVPHAEEGVVELVLRGKRDSCVWWVELERGCSHLGGSANRELRLELCWGITPASTAPCLKGPTASDGNQVFKRITPEGCLTLTHTSSSLPSELSTM